MLEHGPNAPPFWKVALWTPAYWLAIGCWSAWRAALGTLPPAAPTREKTHHPASGGAIRADDERRIGGLMIASFLLRRSLSRSRPVIGGMEKQDVGGMGAPRAGPPCQFGAATVHGALGRMGVAGSMASRARAK